MLTLSDVMDLVKRLGGSILPLHKQEGFITQTICHNTRGGSNKLYYYHEDKTFTCYTNCGSMDIIELVNRIKRYNNPHTAMMYIVTQLGIDINSYGFNAVSTQDRISDWDFIDKLYTKKTFKSEIPIETVDEKVMGTLQKMYYQGWIDENISIPTMIKYGVMYDDTNQQIVIPHRNHKGDLIGIRARNLNEEKADRFGKYLPWIDSRWNQYVHALSLNLFGLYENMETIKRVKKIMIVESEKGVYQTDTYYGKDNFTVALCGKNLSPWHKDMILSLGVNEVIIALDKQYTEVDSLEYHEWCKYLRERIIKQLSPYVKVSVLMDRKDLLEHKDSPTDKGKEVLEQLMDDKIYVETYKYKKEEE